MGNLCGPHTVCEAPTTWASRAHSDALEQKIIHTHSLGIFERGQLVGVVSVVPVELPEQH